MPDLVIQPGGDPTADGAHADVHERMVLLDLPALAHELRTPLGGVLGLASMLLDTPLDSAQRATVHTIRTGAEHLAAILDRFLPADEWARQMIGHPVPFDPVVLTTTVARLLDPQATAKGIHLAVIGHRSLPSLCGADPVAVRQVLVNLAMNAIRVTGTGSVTLRVRPERAMPALRFEVSDTGPGLTDAFRSALDASATGERSVGIGLELSSTLIRSVGGELGAFENPTGGSTVWFTVPYFEVSQPVASDPPPRNLARVLVAEDDELNAQVALTLLERLGYDVDLVCSGAEALRAWHTRAYDLCLLDVNVTDLDGYEVTRCIRELERDRGAHTPIVGLTAGNQTNDRDLCTTAGMDANLAKPIEMRGLIEVLGRFAPPRRNV
jgi:CheY-like chemotaxis protein